MTKWACRSLTCRRWRWRFRHPASALRQRVSDEPPPPLYSVSRGTHVRVFVALPVSLDGPRRRRRLPVAHAQQHREAPLWRAQQGGARSRYHAGRHAADRLPLPARRHPADACPDRPHPPHRGRRPRGDPPARPPRHARTGRAVLGDSSNIGASSAGAFGQPGSLRHPCLARAQIAADRHSGRSFELLRDEGDMARIRAPALRRQHRHRRRQAQPAGAAAAGAGAGRTRLARRRRHWPTRSTSCRATGGWRCGWRRAATSD